jgi:RluA family pseudouridine synthase
VTVGAAVCTDPSASVRAGTRVEIVPAPPPVSDAVPEDLPLRVLHVDSDVIVVDKAAGMVVHPAPGHERGTLVNALLHRFGALAQEGPRERASDDEDDEPTPGFRRPGIVHRLDRWTSGVMVVARTDRARESLMAQLAVHSVDREYLAIVEGLAPERVRYETLHGRHPTDRKRFSGRVRRGKTAVTNVERVEVLAGASLVRCRLETGRTHQIRVHLSEAGFPLLGDAMYGRPRARSARARGRDGARPASAPCPRPGLRAPEHPRAGALRVTATRGLRACARRAPVTCSSRRLTPAHCSSVAAVVRRGAARSSRGRRDRGARANAGSSTDFATSGGAGAAAVRPADDEDDLHGRLVLVDRAELDLASVCLDERADEIGEHALHVVLHARDHTREATRSSALRGVVVCAVVLRRDATRAALSCARRLAASAARGVPAIAALHRFAPLSAIKTDLDFDARAHRGVTVRAGDGRRDAARRERGRRRSRHVPPWRWGAAPARSTTLKLRRPSGFRPRRLARRRQSSRPGTTLRITRTASETTSSVASAAPRTVKWTALPSPLASGRPLSRETVTASASALALRHRRGALRGGVVEVEDDDRAGGAEGRVERQRDEQIRHAAQEARLAHGVLDDRQRAVAARGHVEAQAHAAVRAGSAVDGLSVAGSDLRHGGGHGPTRARRCARRSCPARSRARSRRRSAS